MKLLSLGLLSLKGFMLSCLFLMGSTPVSPCHEIAQKDLVVCDACIIAESSWSEEGVFEEIGELVEVATALPEANIALTLPKLSFEYHKPAPLTHNKDPILALRSSTLQLRI